MPKLLLTLFLVLPTPDPAPPETTASPENAASLDTPAPPENTAVDGAPAVPANAATPDAPASDGDAVKAETPPPPADTVAAAPMRLGPNGKGFTFELGAGLHYTDYDVRDRHAALAAGASVGAFLNDRVAVLLRLSISTIDRQYRAVYTSASGEPYAARVYYGRTTGFFGPIVQYFVGNRLMLSAGVGVAGRPNYYEVDVYGTDEGEREDRTGDSGLGLPVRVGFALYQRPAKGAVRLSAEALPTLIADRWGITTGLAIEVQIY